MNPRPSTGLRLQPPCQGSSADKSAASPADPLALAFAEIARLEDKLAERDRSIAELDRQNRLLVAWRNRSGTALEKLIHHLRDIFARIEDDHRAAAARDVERDAERDAHPETPFAPPDETGSPALPPRARAGAPRPAATGSEPPARRRATLPAHCAAALVAIFVLAATRQKDRP